MRDDVDGGGHRVRRVREHRIERYPVDSVGEETTRERDGVVHHDRRVLYALSHGARVGFTRKGRRGDVLLVASLSRVDAHDARVVDFGVPAPRPRRRNGESQVSHRDVHQRRRGRDHARARDIGERDGRTGARALVCLRRGVLRVRHRQVRQYVSGNARE